MTARQPHGAPTQCRARVEGQAQADLPWERKGLSRVDRVIAFLQFLPIPRGKLIGRNFELLPDQRAFIEDIYGRSGSERVRIGRCG